MLLHLRHACLHAMDVQLNQGSSGSLQGVVGKKVKPSQQLCLVVLHNAPKPWSPGSLLVHHSCGLLRMLHALVAME